MALHIVTADERLAKAGAKTTMAIFGPSGVGKTSLLKTLPPEETLCIDLEAGMKSEGFKELVADYDRTWPTGVTRTRDILDLVEERDGVPAKP